MISPTVDAATPDPFAQPAQPPGHPESPVLRSYLAGALAGDERLRLVQHLRDCEDCRAALEDLRAQFATAITEPGALGPAAGIPPGRAMSRVAPPRAASSAPGLKPASAASPAPPAANARADGLRLPAWLAAAALLVILVETAALLRSVWTRMDEPAPRQAQGSSAPAGVATIPRIKVVFVASASDQAIRALLRTVHGRIVDGPAPDGAYVVEIRPAPTPGGETALQILRNRIDIVKQVGAGPDVETR